LLTIKLSYATIFSFNHFGIPKYHVFIFKCCNNHFHKHPFDVVTSFLFAKNQIEGLNFFLKNANFVVPLGIIVMVHSGAGFEDCNY